ncbi:YlcI/YnfO family protein [Pectobacterium sp. CHL-2024]|uniref:YlcI/YnfO family protein n=1 Tax=Pectobacterium sp. CHL-2024 TaxID=3377079 RepID=UPI003808ABC0
MATKAVNAKSRKLEARVQHDISEAMEKVKEPDESTGQFIVSAMQGEIKRRQRKQTKD